MNFTLQSMLSQNLNSNASNIVFIFNRLKAR